MFFVTSPTWEQVVGAENADRIREQEPDMAVRLDSVQGYFAPRRPDTGPKYFRDWLEELESFCYITAEDVVRYSKAAFPDS